MGKIKTIYIFQPGDVIFVYREGGLYKHFGVYTGDNEVVHFAPAEANKLDAATADVRRTSLTDFASGDEVHLDAWGVAEYPREEIVRRAQSRIGQQLGCYNLMFNNCEHFARWCQSGHHESFQVERVIEGVVNAIFPLMRLLR